jgi:hypothetical protein
MCRRNPAENKVSAIAAVNKCPADTLHAMLTILAALPVRTAVSRSRENILQSRTYSDGTAQHHIGRKLNALIMLQTHRDLLPSTDALIDKYILSGADGRRRRWTLPSTERFVTTGGWGLQRTS